MISSMLSVNKENLAATLFEKHQWKPDTMLITLLFFFHIKSIMSSWVTFNIWLGSFSGVKLLWGQVT